MEGSSQSDKVFDDLAPSTVLVLERPDLWIRGVGQHMLCPVLTYWMRVSRAASA